MISIPRPARTRVGIVWIVFCFLFVAGGCDADPERESAAVDTVVIECRLDGYVSSDEGVALQGLNPDTKLARLPQNAIARISGVAAGRLRITHAVSVEEEPLFAGETGGPAWLPAGALVTATEPLASVQNPGAAVDAEAGGASDESLTGAVPVLVEAQKDAVIAGKLAPYDAVNILGCRDDWAYIEGTSPDGDPVRGWLAPESQCANPVSSCS